MTIRYGLIGYGRWGRRHANAIHRAHDAELAAIAVMSEQTADLARSEQTKGEPRTQVTVTMNYRDLLMDDTIDVIDIALPNDLHYEVAVEALQSRKHVLVEKPMALRAKECQDMMDAAKKANRILHVGLQLRYSPLWGKVKQMIDEGKLGSLKSGFIQLSRDSFRSSSGGWRADIHRVGSWILEEPIHYLDLFSWYFQGTEHPISVYAAANSRSSQLAEQYLFENLSTTILFSRGGHATFVQTLADSGHHVTAQLIGTLGNLKVWWHGAKDEDSQPLYGIEYSTSLHTEVIDIETVPGEISELDKQIERFTQVVQAAKSPDVSVEDGLWSVKLSEAAQQSAISGRVVEFG